MRLFTAIYPSEAAAEHLDRALASIAGSARNDPGAGLRWVPREQWHVTLAFHGEVGEGTVPGYVDALTAALSNPFDEGLGPFDCALAGGGTFSARTLFTGVGLGVEAVRRLAGLCNGVAVETGIRADTRAGGRPHLTLARASASRGRVRSDQGRRGRTPDPFAAWAAALALYQGTTWVVDEVRVVESRLGEGRSGGPLHVTVASVPLATTRPSGPEA